MLYNILPSVIDSTALQVNLSLNRSLVPEQETSISKQANYIGKCPILYTSRNKFKEGYELLQRYKEKIIAFYKDRQGSETIEMIMTTSMIICFLIIALTFFSYVATANDVNYVVKQLCRNIETTGEVNIQEMKTKFHDALTRDQLVPEDIEITDVSDYYPGSSTKIQLKGTFKLIGRCNYTVNLINPGSFSGFDIVLPIRTSVSGMSEVYWGS